MLYSEMIESIRIKIDDVRKTRYPTDTPLRVALNEAGKQLYRELLRKNLFSNINSVTITFTANNQEIAFLATDGSKINPQKIVNVYDEDNLSIPLYEETQSKQSDKRSVYLKRVLTKDRVNANIFTETWYLGWYTIPSSTFNITVHYVPRISEFNIETETAKGVRGETLNWLPEEHHDIIVLRAVILLLGIDEDNVTFWYTIYKEALDSMLESIKPIDQQGSEVVDVISEGIYDR